MFAALAIALITLHAPLQQAPCKTGEVLAIDRGHDYTLNICGAGIVGLRGVEPPLRSPQPAELLGGIDVGPQAVRYAYVFLPDKTHLNAEMIRRGYGYAELQGSHPRREEFKALEAVARRSKVGLWAS